MQLVMLLTAVAAALASMAASATQRSEPTKIDSEGFASLLEPLRHISGKLAFGLSLTTLCLGLLLLLAGVLCRIRWSTIVGGSTLMIYVVSLIGLVRLPEQLQTTAITMMVGGGLFFGTAVLLSIYRDRLLAIPQRAQAGEGVFRVLKWR